MPKEKIASSPTKARSTAKASSKAVAKPAFTDAVKVIRLLAALGRRQGLTAEEAAALLEEAGMPTTLRSASRLLAGLADDPRFPVEVIKDDKPYRYRWDEKAPAWVLPALSPEERAVMTAARLLTEKRFPAQTLTFFNRTAKTEAAFPLRIAEDHFLTVPARVKADIWSAVTESLQIGHYLKIRHRENRRTLEKTVLPLLLLVKEGRLLLLAREQGETETLALPLNTIVSAFVTSFEPPVKERRDLDEIADQTGLNPGAGDMTKVSFLTSDRDFLSDLKESPLSPTQKILEGGDTALVTFVERDSALLRRWLKEKGDVLRDIAFEPFGKADDTESSLIED